MIVLVTGSAGFLGCHFVKALKRDGHLVYVRDVRSGENALSFFRETDAAFSPDLLVHCAAVSPHRAAIDSKALAVGAGNLELDAALFQWAARAEPGRVVYFSSSAAYPVVKQQGRSWKCLLKEEDQPLCGDIGQPDAIYGHVKVTGELLAAAYRQQGGTVTVVRPFSGYGEDQSADFPFGAFSGRAKGREDPFTVWGDGSQVRDWVHVDDVVGAVLAAVDRGVDGPVNICTGVGTSMAELAALFAAEAGYDPRFDYRADKPTGVAYRVGDPTRLHEFYTPKISIEEGVRRALAGVTAHGPG